jgi:hypothetical protein
LSAGDSQSLHERGREKTVAAIKKLGGKVKVDEKRPGRRVMEVDLSFQQVTDADLAHLKGLTSLKSLELGGTKVTDVGLPHLKDLPRLELLLRNRSRPEGDRCTSGSTAQAAVVGHQSSPSTMPSLGWTAAFQVAGLIAANT